MYIIHLDIPILLNKIDYVFTTPCCTCSNSVFNDCIILANKQGDVILFSFKSMTVIYNFQNIFQSQSVNFHKKISFLKKLIFVDLSIKSMSNSLSWTYSFSSNSYLCYSISN